MCKRVSCNFIFLYWKLQAKTLVIIEIFTEAVLNNFNENIFQNEVMVYIYTDGDSPLCFL